MTNLTLPCKICQRPNTCPETPTSGFAICLHCHVALGSPRNEAEFIAALDRRPDLVAAVYKRDRN